MTIPWRGHISRRRLRPLTLGALLAGAATSMGLAGAIADVARQRPPMPTITKPVPFGTPEADRILAALQVFPPDNPWNEDVSKRPLHPRSARMIEKIGPHKPLDYNLDMNFVIVPKDQKRVPVEITEFPQESDPGPFPIPDEAPIENWPLRRNEDKTAVPKPGQTLEEFQRQGTGDRHLLVVDPLNGRLHEFWTAYRTDRGWKAGCAATFDLTSNAMRPERWTSADAAGLPVFPAVVRYDEVARGRVEHAMRFTVRYVQGAWVYPARHRGMRLTDPDLPRMGERFRLRRDFDVLGFPPHVQAILKGLKTYGMFVADNGGDDLNDWMMSISPDARLQGLETLHRVKGRDFEVILPTGPDEGPRKR